MINSDFSTLNSFRADGRRAQQLRETSIQLQVDANYEGSCLYKQGLTQVLCLVRGPYQRHNSSENILKIDYSVAPFSSLEKRKIKFDREFSEFAESIRKGFQSIIIPDTYTRSQIQVTVTIIENQGSAKSCIMNCITLGLASAGICMRDLLISCTAAMHNGAVILDTNQEQQYDTTNEVVLSYIHNESRIDFIELERAKMKQQQFKKMYNIAINGCYELHRRIKKSLMDYARKKLLVF